MIMTTRRFTIFLLIGHKLRLLASPQTAHRQQTAGHATRENDEKEEMKRQHGTVRNHSNDTHMELKRNERQKKAIKRSTYKSRQATYRGVVAASSRRMVVSE